MVQQEPWPTPSYEEAFASFLLVIEEGEAWVVWGASNKGGRLANIFDNRVEKIRYFVDVNPKKQNLYLPGTGHLIKSPKAAIADKELSKVLVVNPVYQEEVQRMLNRPQVQLSSL